MIRFGPIAAVLLMLGSVLSATAHSGLLGRSRQVTVYYYAVPVIASPVYIAPPPVVCIPVAPVLVPRTLAQPEIAPPSMGREPPLNEPPRPGPTMQNNAPPPSSPAGSQPPTGVQQREARYFDAYAVAPTASAPASGPRVSVSFWNLSAHEMVLKVGTQRLTLACGRSATLDLERQFTWQIEGREAQAGRVGANDTALEIVIRR